MATEKRSNLRVISNVEREEINEHKDVIKSDFHTNPMYERLLNFRNLQEQQKKRFTVEDLLKW